MIGMDVTTPYNCEVRRVLYLFHVRPRPDRLRYPGPDRLPIREHGPRYVQSEE
jgi:hypothetical protein